MFKTAGQDEPALRRRAELILAAMGELGTAAMAVGERDLNAGLEFLKKTASSARVPLLSANLRGADGKLAFSPATIASIGPVKAGLIGVSPASGTGQQGIQAAPPVPAAIRAARKLKGKVDVVIVLAAIPYADALQLAKEAGGAIDLILQSHEARGGGSAQGSGQNFVIPTGERGRQLGRLELDLSGAGPFTDRGQADRDRQAIAFLDRQILVTQKRSETVSNAEVRKSLADALQSFEARRRALTQDLASSARKPGRSLDLTYVTLGSEIREDPRLKAQVEKLEPPGSVVEPTH